MLISSGPDASYESAITNGCLKMTKCYLKRHNYYQRFTRVYVGILRVINFCQAVYSRVHEGCGSDHSPFKQIIVAFPSSYASVQVTFRTVPFAARNTGPSYLTLALFGF